MSKKAILLVNVGTPDKPDAKHVRKFLLQFLNDSRVIDLPWIVRKILVNLIIVPFRVKKSTLLYKELWTDKGSPLLYYLESLVVKLQIKLKNEYTVMGAMSYGHPSLKEAMQKLKEGSFDEITLLPLYPQYASSTSGSVQDSIMSEIRKWEIIPKIRFISQFYSHPSFIEVFANKIKSYQPEKFDLVIFSYHGLPLRQVQKTHPNIGLESCNCENQLPEHGKYCYKATCYETTRLLATKLNLSSENYSISFQSRLSNNWLTPFTDKTLVLAAQNGCKRILVVAPSFVTDCLETVVEIDKTFKNLFLLAGGEELVLVESLNDKEEWVEAIVEILC